ncbi:MAG: ADP-forming succinate--CoA ligase subunit beta, partial [Thermoleophilia bacterium]|nr:ADP-forming succinate--CoA ligase subunit beta [Thermoleophilia bacterium]
MDLLEYQGKRLLERHGIDVPAGDVARTPDEARAAAAAIGGRVAVKAQVRIGGRGKAGGIKLADSPDDAAARAADILGMDIRGHAVQSVWIEGASDIRREYYASITFDRAARRPLVMLSAVGGMDIEEVARTRPDALVRRHIDPLIGFQAHDARWLAYRARIDADAIGGVIKVLASLYRAFIELDAMLVEINPLVVTGDGRVIALDAKVTIDGNSVYRHPELEEMGDVAPDDPQEAMARERGVTYVKLDGDVGILGNGAGLVMSTLDVVALAGGRPANFLDAGGGSKADEVVTALEVLLSDPKVRVLLINIFGGITRCDEVATGLLTALERLGGNRRVALDVRVIAATNRNPR